MAAPPPADAPDPAASGGAGKTTTLRMITGRTPPTSGTATVDGHDVVDDREAARAVLNHALCQALPAGAGMRLMVDGSDGSEIFGATGLSVLVFLVWGAGGLLLLSRLLQRRGA